MGGLRAIAEEEPMISAVRGRGLLIAFDLPDKSSAKNSIAVSTIAACSQSAAGIVQFAFAQRLISIPK